MRTLRTALDRYSTIEDLELTGGEPLLCPDIWRAARLAVSRGVRVKLSTNGVFLQDQIQEIGRAGIFHLNVSLNAVSPDQYRQVTGNDRATFDHILEGLEGMLRARRAQNGPGTVSLSWVCHRGNYELIPRAIDLAERVKVDQVIFYNLIPYGAGGFDRTQCLYRDDRQVLQLLGGIRPRHSNLRVILPRLYPRANTPILCTQPFTTLVICPDQSVAACCVMPYSRVGELTGNHDPWNAEKLRDWRRQLLEGNGVSEALCQVCPWSVTVHRPWYVPAHREIR
jgi:MoaA/NifB/PqqE/SkfB family radical SAM enzyme